MVDLAWLATPTPMPTAPSEFDAITGGWPGLLQGGVGGFVGALVGVIGALVVALITTRRELDHQRQQARDQASIEASGRLRAVLHEMWSHLENVSDTALLIHREYALRRLEAWGELKSRLDRQVSEDALLLPVPLQTKLNAVERRVDGAYGVDYDEFDFPVHIERGHIDKFNELQAEIDEAIGELNKYRQALYDPVEKPRLVKRLWFAWLIAGLFLVLALVLGGFVVFD